MTTLPIAIKGYLFKWPLLNLIKSLNRNLLSPVQFPPQGTTRRVNSSSQAIGTAQRLVTLHTVPWIQPHMIFPECLPFGIQRLLRGDLQPRNRLPGKLLLVLFSSGVLYALLLEVFQQLQLKIVHGHVYDMEILKPFVQDVFLVAV
jgi:hypothetical protein